MAEKANVISDMIHGVHIYEATNVFYEDLSNPRRRYKFDHAGVSRNEGTERSNRTKILYPKSSSFVVMNFQLKIQLSNIW